MCNIRMRKIKELTRKRMQKKEIIFIESSFKTM